MELPLAGPPGAVGGPSGDQAVEVKRATAPIPVVLREILEGLVGGLEGRCLRDFATEGRGLFDLPHRPGPDEADLLEAINVDLEVREIEGIVIKIVVNGLESQRGRGALFLKPPGVMKECLAQVSWRFRGPLVVARFEELEKWLSTRTCLLLGNNGLSATTRVRTRICTLRVSSEPGRGGFAGPWTTW